MSRPHALLIDLGNVLVTFDHMATCERLAPRCGLSAAEVYQRLFASGAEQRFDIGALDEAGFATEACERLGLPASDSEVVLTAWAEIFSRHEANLAALEPLRERFRLVLLSNTNPTHYRACLALAPELQHFHGKVLSYEARCRKPEPEIFARALEVAGCSPVQAFFLDDGAEHVAAAATAGIPGRVHIPGEAMQLPS